MTFKIHYKAPVMKTLYIRMSWHKDGAARMSIRPTHAESADVWQRLNNCSAKKSSNLLDPSNSCAAFCCNDKQSQGRGAAKLQGTDTFYMLLLLIAPMFLPVVTLRTEEKAFLGSPRS